MSNKIAYNTHEAFDKYLKENATGEYEKVVDRNDTIIVFSVSSGKLTKHRLGRIRSISYEQAEALVESINNK